MTILLSNFQALYYLVEIGIQSNLFSTMVFFRKVIISQIQHLKFARFHLLYILSYYKCLRVAPFSVQCISLNECFPNHTSMNSF